jgi:hypothetical protein
MDDLQRSWHPAQLLVRIREYINHIAQRKKPVLSDWLNTIHAVAATGSMMDKRKMPSSTVIFKSPPYFSVKI